MNEKFHGSSSWQKNNKYSREFTIYLLAVNANVL